MKQFAAKTAQLGPTMKAAEVDAVRKGALKTTTTIRDEIRAVAPGGTLKMNGKPKRIGAAFKMLTGAQAVVFANGPLHLIERDTSPHYLPKGASSSRVSYRLNGGKLRATEKVRKGRAGKAKGVSIPGIGFRRSALHPGTRGKHPFEKGADAARVDVGRAMLTDVVNGLSAALK